MRNLLFGAILAIIVVLIYRVIAMRKIEKTKLASDVKYLHIVAVFTMLFYALALIKVNATFALLSHALFYVCSDIMLFYFIVYINDFTQKLGEHKMLRLAVKFAIAVDVVLHIANVFNQRLYSMKLYVDETGCEYYCLDNHKYPFLYHSVLVVFLVAFAILLLILSIMKAARVYVKQYWIILQCFLVGVLFNILYGVSDIDYDYSILVYGLLAVAIYYLTFQYVPKGLVEKTLAMVVQNMKDGVMCFTIYGRCIYANAYAKQAFHSEDNYRGLEQYYRTWVAGRRLEEISNANWQGETEIGGETRIFMTRFRQIMDEQERCIGSYFVMHDETEHMRQLEEERYQNSHDALTGLYNREYFYEKAAGQIKENPNVRYVIYCADVQNFKIINDVFGVKKGDEVLKRIADMFLSLTTGDTICSRLSADRFALCIREEKINHERYLEAVDKVCNIGEANSYRAQIYAGICPVKNVNTPISTYCDRAFLAIESIKGDYHQTIAYYDDALRKQILAGQHMVNDFRSAIVKQEFQIFLQPLVNVSGKMLGAEALVRWFRPVHGMTLPEDFVEVFERSGLISAMDQYVWELACKQLQIWKENGYTGYYISVNISPKDFYFMDIYRTLTTLVECYEISPHNLCLEITETSIMKDASKNLQTIDELRNYGFRVIMDDFGSGYSSLNMLQDMNLDAIKIDMEFLRKNDDPERSKTILEMILELSKELGIEVVTEGIEREDQLDYMQKLGCQLFQGYYFAKPMPVDQFERKYF